MKKSFLLILLAVLFVAPSLVFAQSNIPTSRNDTASQWPIGSGYNPNNGSAIQHPNISSTETFPTGSGYSYPSDNAFGQQGITQGQSAGPAPSSVPFLDKLIPNSLFGGDNALNKIFNQMFYLGLIIAVILAIVMIIRGGVEYMTIDAMANKESGKKRVQAALGGLLLAFSTILIFNTISPGITSLRIVFPALTEVEQTQIEADITNAVNSYLGLSETQYQEYLTSGKIPTNITPQAQKILAQALGAVGNLNTGTIDNTNGGRLACAAAVNKIVEAATGQQVGGGLSTQGMFTALQNNPRFQLVPGGTQNAIPGDIVISPSSGSATGHVGIAASNGAGQIISNSSSQRKVLQNHTASSWNRYYGGKGLPVYIYRPL